MHQSGYIRYQVQLQPTSCTLLSAGASATSWSGFPEFLPGGPFAVTTTSYAGCNAPAAPVTLTALGLPGFISLNWAPAASGTNPVSSYEIFRATCTACPSTLLSGIPEWATSYDDAATLLGIDYTYTVRAVDTWGNAGPFSPPASASLPPPLPVVLPTCGDPLWVAGPSMPTGRYNPGVAVIGGTVYVVGGSTAGLIPLNELEAYNSATRTWTVRAAMPTARAYLGAVAVNGILYAIGGDGGGYMNTVEAYDPVTDSWATKAPLPEAKKGMGVAAMGTTIFVFGGEAGYLAVNSAQAYDTLTDTWSAIAGMPDTRSYGAAVAMNGLILTMAGLTNAGWAQTAYVYDPGTNGWGARPSTVFPRFVAGAASALGRVWVAGGQYNSTVLDRVEAYDPVGDAWTLRTSLPLPRNAVGMAAIGSTLYVIGGSNGTNALTLGYLGTGVAGPDAPLGLTALGVPNGIVLNWSPAVPGSAPVAAYELFRSNSVAGPFLPLTTVAGTTFTDSPVSPPGVSYFYRVRAIDAVGDAGCESVTVDAAAAVTPPGAPGSLTALGQPGEIVLSWSSAAPGTYPLSAYEIYRSTCGTCPPSLLVTVPISWSGYADGSAPAGIPCTYTVRAMDTSGLAGPFSSTATGTASPSLPPPPPPASNSLACDAPAGAVAVLAGTSSTGYNGDGIPATAAQLNLPSGIAADAAGNVWIADEANQRVRRVDAVTGQISTFAGNGVAGSGGDGGPATVASLNVPYGIAVDASGTVYIADLWNNRIRAVAAGSGIIRTVAGNSSPGYNGDGIAATAAQLYGPQGVCVDAAGNLYIADSFNYRVRKVTLTTGLISTIAGTGTAGYNGDGIVGTAAQLFAPVAVAVDPAGNVYIADRDNARVRRVDQATGIITTVAGTGAFGYNGDGIAATTASLSQPTGVTLDLSGNLLIADRGNGRIRKVDAATGVISTFVMGDANSIAVDGFCRVVFAGFSNYARRVDPALITIAKRLVSPAPAMGDPVTYSIVVTNFGLGTVTALAVTDTVPSGVTVTGTDAPAGFGAPAVTSVASGTRYDWAQTGLTFLPGQVLTFTVTGMAGIPMYATTVNNRAGLGADTCCSSTALVSGAVTFTLTGTGPVPPGAPAMLTAVAQSYFMGLNWSPAPPGTNPIMDYEIFRATCPACPASLIDRSSSTEYRDYGSVPGVTYTYTVRAESFDMVIMATSYGPFSPQASATREATPADTYAACAPGSLWMNGWGEATPPCSCGSGVCYGVAADSLSRVVVIGGLPLSGPFIRWYDAAGALTQSVTGALAFATAVGVAPGDAVLTVGNGWTIHRYTPAGGLSWSVLESGAAADIAVMGTGESVVTGADGGWAVRKYTAGGAPLWTVLESGTPTGVAVDGAGNSYVAGNSPDWTLRAYDPNGVPRWTVGRTGTARDVTVDGSGNVYVAGYLSNGASGVDWLLEKYTSAGTLVWSRTIDS